MDTETKSFILLVCAIALAHGGVRVMWGASLTRRQVFGGIHR